MDIHQQTNHNPESPKGFTDELKKRIDELVDFHDNLLRDYNASALEQQELHFYALVKWFDSMVENHSNPFFNWVRRSEQSRKLVKATSQKAHEVALYFEEVNKEGYRRTTCRRKINSLITAIENLKKFNDRRVT